MDAEETCHANMSELPKAQGETPQGTCSADGLLVQRLRRGDADADAGYDFFRDYYPGVYRFLFWLTERSEQAEDLAQETFVRAWLHLDGFDLHGSLRAWLHRIAHREFLRSVRRETPTSLEVVGEVAAPEATAFTEAVALRQIVRRLPSEEREVVLLHYLEGYTSSEIAPIVGIPASTVRRRLAQARERLRQELGEGDLVYLNEPTVPMRQWAWLPLDQMHALETRLSRGSPGVRETPESEAMREESMEPRELPRQATVGAAGLILSEAEKDVVDSRLTQKVTCAFKGTALSDLCEHLRAETGVHLAAGPSVADEKVTLFCEKLPLREVMRQLSRSFGYIWRRSGEAGEYHYELVQDVRSQLLEEELRNRDRNAALVALEREIERYRPYLSLSPEEAREQALKAPLAERKLLENLAWVGWGPVHLYFRLSAHDLAVLRAGQELYFSAQPKASQRLLPPDLERGVLESQHHWRVIRTDGGFALTEDLTDPRGLPLAAIPEARAEVTLKLQQTELGQFALRGAAGFFTAPPSNQLFTKPGPYAVGVSPVVNKPKDATADAQFSRGSILRGPVTIMSRSQRGAPTASPDGAAAAPLSAHNPGPDIPSVQVTSAEVLEALHEATGLPMVADYYSRLHEPEAVSVQSQPLFQALNQIADALHLRWTKDGEWLQIRSMSFYNDRPKEVPNRLLSRWAASRREHALGSGPHYAPSAPPAHGVCGLTLDDIVEIAGLSDTQLDAAAMAEGARELWGLAEWDLARNGNLRPHLRYLAGFTPGQRREAMSTTGLPFTRMSVEQQQQFITHAIREPLHSLEELAGATLLVDYAQPGWFQWGDPSVVNFGQWVVPLESGPRGKRVVRPRVRERTPEEAMQALCRVDRQIRKAVLRVMSEADPRLQASPPTEEAQIYPTRLQLAIVYIPSDTNARALRVVDPGHDFFTGG